MKVAQHAKVRMQINLSLISTPREIASNLLQNSGQYAACKLLGLRCRQLSDGGEVKTTAKKGSKDSSSCRHAA